MAAISTPTDGQSATLAELERLAARATRDEMLARIHSRKRVTLKTPGRYADPGGARVGVIVVDASSVQARCHLTARPKRLRISPTSIFTVTPTSIY